MKNLSVVLGLLLSALTLALPTRAATTTVQIAQDGLSFTPSSVTIAPGDTVHWVWAASHHSTTSGTPGTPSSVWDSSIHDSGFTFDHTFATAGTFPYFCTPHGACCGMVGTVTVQATTNHALSGRIFKWVLVNGILTKQGIAGASVVLQQNQSGVATATTDANGFYTFFNRAAGNYSIVPQKSGVVFDPISQNVTLGSTDISKINFSTYLLSVVAQNAQGKALSGISITLSGATSATLSTDATGTVVFKNLGSGTYTLAPAPQGGFNWTPTGRTVILPTIAIANLSPNGRAKFIRTPASTKSDKKS